MTVAEMIKKTRLEHHMTQDEYGDKFGVTRQTVSSWENEKSMPDLQMLITICNTYKVSLDALLNDDNVYVNKIDVTQKIGRILKRVLPVLGIIACVFLLMVGAWKVKEMRENEGFASRATKLGFVLEDGHYIMRDANAEYNLPNQKLPFMRFDFHAQFIYAEYTTKDYQCKITLDYDGENYTFGIQYGLDASIVGTVTTGGDITYEQLSKEDKALLAECRGDFEEIILRMKEYYNVAYDLTE